MLRDSAVDFFVREKECNECNYYATHKSNLKTDQDSLHKGIRNKCKEWDYQATEKSRLKTHQDYVHNCNDCD